MICQLLSGCRADLPNVLHYGLLYGIEEKSWEFDKHWFQDFNALRCPPWEAPPPGEHPKQGLFPFPPRPSSLSSKVCHHSATGYTPESGCCTSELFSLYDHQ